MTAAGVTFERMGWHHQLIYDSSGNLIGVRNPRAKGADFFGGAGGGGSFALLSGQPSDNLALVSALAAKQDKLPNGTLGHVLTWNGSSWAGAPASSGGGGSATPLFNSLSGASPGTAALDAALGPTLAAKFNTPTGTTAQYVRGDGSLGAFPAFGAGTVTSVGLNPPAAGIQVFGSPITTSGSFSLTLANDLGALEALTGTGLAQRSGDDTWTLLALDADTALAAASDSRIPTQRAVKAYADALLAAADAMVFRGVIDCSGNPVYPAADAGHTFRVSVAGRIGGSGGPAVEAGDLLICLADGTAAGNHATVGASWSVAQSNVDGAVTGPAGSTAGHLASFSGTNGKVVQDAGAAITTDGALTTNSDARLPTERAVRAFVLARTFPLVNDDTTGGTTSAWSAERGKVAASNIAANTQAIAGKLTAPANPGSGQVITWNGSAWVAQDQNKPAGVTVTASRNLAPGDIGNELLNASGAFTLTIPTGLGAALDVIFFHPSGTGTQTLAAAPGVTLNDPYNLGLAVPSNGLAAIQCDGSNVWTRVG